MKREEAIKEVTSRLDHVQDILEDTDEMIKEQNLNVGIVLLAVIESKEDPKSFGFSYSCMGDKRCMVIALCELFERTPQLFDLVSIGMKQPQPLDLEEWWKTRKHGGLE